MKKYILSSLLLVLVVLLCAGCGKERKTSSTEIVNQQDIPIDNVSVDSETGPGSMGLEMDEDGFYVIKDYVKTTEMTVNVRITPSTDAPIYKMLEEGTVLERSGYNDEWSRVVLEDTNFYVYSDYVEETTPPDWADIDVPEDVEDVPTVKNIIIDPANQASDNIAKEQVGPGSEITKQAATTGSVGAAYGTKEYELNLLYAQLLKAELESRGYTVTLTRDSNNVDLTNKERAEMANNSGATVLIRLQMNFSANDDMVGVMALTMSDNSMYNSYLYEQSNELATRILQGITEDISTTNHGIYQSEDMTLINWSKIPVAVISLGFLSNEAEEANLVSSGYQATMIQGIADGIDYYFGVGMETEPDTDAE